MEAQPLTDKEAEVSLLSLLCFSLLLYFFQMTSASKSPCDAGMLTRPHGTKPRPETIQLRPQPLRPRPMCNIPGVVIMEFTTLHQNYF